jgi:prepilin-type N-terminal cleavage/methylation domain-containing protein
MRDLVVGKKCDNKKGFTLIELTIVLIIMSFLFAVAGPRIAKSLSGLSLTTSTKKLLQRCDMRAARQSTNLKYTV